MYCNVRLQITCFEISKINTINLGVKMDIPPSAYAAMGAITAAIIAGGISFIISVLVKDQKTSEFRQAWIDGLRNDIAELISVHLVICDVVREMIKVGKKKEEVFTHLLEKDEHFCRLEMADARIKLRINPKEHVRLLSALSAIREYGKSGQILNSEAADAVVDELIKESQEILKSEWRRVKRGEPAFAATKWISLLILLTALILWAAYARGYLHIEMHL